MTEEKVMRLSQVARVLNVGVPTVINHLSAKGFKIDNNPNTKINAEQLEFLSKDFKSDALLGSAPKREEAPAPAQNGGTEDSPIRYFRTANAPTNGATTPVLPETEVTAVVPPKEEKIVEPVSAETPAIGLKVVGKIDLDAKPAPTPPPTPPTKPEAPKPVPAPVAEVPKPVVVAPTPPVAEPVPTKPPVVEAPAPAPVAEVAKPVIEVAPTPTAEQTPAVVVPTAKVAEEKQPERVARKQENTTPPANKLQQSKQTDRKSVV